MWAYTRGPATTTSTDEDETADADAIKDDKDKGAQNDEDGYGGHNNRR
jgi:hypothetical protein